MRGFDTNVLVRYLVTDDPRQAAIVTKLITQAAEADVPIYLNTIVLCETVWVLESGYEYARDAIAHVLEKLLLTQQIAFEERDHVWRALRRYRDGRGDFADYLIGEKNLAGGCDCTTSFDRALMGEEGFEVLA